jgi:hypothetical protein
LKLFSTTGTSFSNCYASNCLVDKTVVLRENAKTRAMRMPRLAPPYHTKGMILKDYYALSPADRAREEQAFYDRFADSHLKATLLKLAAAVGLFVVAIAGISAALHHPAPAGEATAAVSKAPTSLLG